MKKPHILVVGSLVMDLIVSSSRFPAAGETVIGTEFHTASGGKGANQAVQAARLGAAVTMVGRVGDDAFGSQILDSVGKAGIDTAHITVTEGISTAIGNVQLEVTDTHTENRIIVVPGANMRLTVDDIAFLEKDMKRYDMVMLQHEIPLEINDAVIDIAYRHGVPVMLNTAPYAPVSPASLAKITYISPNEHEAALLTGMQISTEPEARDGIHALLASGVKNAIITMGGQGAAFGNDAGFFMSPCIAGIAVADPTAAGDSFVAAFSFGICCGLSPADAMRFANYTAAITVSKMGAQPSLPTLPEVMQLIHTCGTATEQTILRFFKDGD